MLAGAALAVYPSAGEGIVAAFPWGCWKREGDGLEIQFSLPRVCFILLGK